MAARVNCDIALVHNLSFSCLDDPEYCKKNLLRADGCSCYPFESNLSLMAGLLCIFNAVLGLAGNLLTISAIPIAKAHGRFGFSKEWDSTTFFILNLAFSDLIYCAITLPMYALQYLLQYWPWGQKTCVLTATVRYVNAFADWMLLGFIALSKCLGTISEDKFLDRKKSWAVVAMTWAYSVTLVSMVVFEKIGRFGYYCRIGKCDFIHLEGSSIEPHQFMYGVGFSVPCAVICISYVVIWIKVRSSTKRLCQIGSTDHTKSQLHSRDLRMTWTLLLLCLSYLVFVTPITVINIADPTAELADLHLLLHCLYWFQYSLNFVLYALKNEQYRKAYLDFLHRLWLRIWLCCCCCNSASKNVIDINARNNAVPMSNFEGIDISREVTTESISRKKEDDVFYFCGQQFQRNTGSAIVLLTMPSTNIFLSSRDIMYLHSFSDSVELRKKHSGFQRRYTL